MRTKHANERRLKRDLETSRTDIEEISKYTGQERRELVSQITEQSSAVRELQQDNQGNVTIIIRAFYFASCLRTSRASQKADLNCLVFSYISLFFFVFFICVGMCIFVFE